MQFKSWTVLFVVMCGMFCVQVLHAGVYLRVTETGAYELTNEPGNRSFKLIAGTRSKNILNKTDQAVEIASGKYGLPESLIYAIIENESKDSGGIMKLPAEAAEDLSDTEIEDPMDNIMTGSAHLAQLFSKFNGNMSLTLGAYYTGAEAVDEAGGLPDKQTRQFVDSVVNSFGKLDDREEIFYTFQNEDGVTTVSNISP